MMWDFFGGWQNTWAHFHGFLSEVGDLWRQKFTYLLEEGLELKLDLRQEPCKSIS
jgi:hypothetical protein